MIKREKIISKMKQMKFTGGWKFFFIMIGIYLLLSLRYKYLVLEAVFGTLSVFVDMLPILIVVFFVMFITNILLDKGVVQKHLGENVGLKAYLYAAISGILISGPPYVLYPLLGDLKNGGMKNSLIAVFLFNRNVKIPFVPVMIFYFGIAFTLIISVLIIIFSFLNGYLVGRLVSD